MHNVAFDFLGFQVYWYGILAAAGFVAAFATASRRAPRAGITGEEVFNLAPWIIVGAVLGARILYVISYWKKDFAGLPPVQLAAHILNMRSGLVYYGGLIGASLGTVIFCRRQKLPLWRMADVIAPSISLGHAFGRVGCFMTGCCYGRACSLPWAVHFPADHWTHGVGVHPTQLYEASLNLLFYFFLAWLFQRRKFDGQIFAVYLIGYAFIRGFVEFFRGDYDASQYLGGIFSPGQTVSIVILAAGILLWRKQHGTRLPRGTPAPA